MSDTIESLGIRRWQGRLRKALIVEHPDPVLDSELTRIGIEPHRLHETPDEQALIKILAEGQHDLLFKRSRLLVSEQVVQASKRLAAVMLCCIGDDSVDKEACARNGVLVMNDPVSNGRSVAELVIGEIVALSRRLFDAVAATQDSRWRKNNRARFEIRGKRLGILGLGRIGRQVAQLGEAMGLRVIFYDNNAVAQEVGTTLGWELAESVGELFQAADVVAVHVSATDCHGNSNRDLLKYETLRLMGEKPGESPRIFMNLARGFIHPAEDLKRAVHEGHIGCAVVDVFPDEPRSSREAWHNPYADEPAIFATPHIGAATQESQPRIARYMAKTTELFSLHGALRNCVFFPKANIAMDEGVSRYRLCVVHVDKRGTKKAVDDAIYHAGASNLQSAHMDFPDFGIAYDLSALDRELTADQLNSLIRQAVEITGDTGAIRAVRTIDLKV